MVLLLLPFVLQLLLIIHVMKNRNDTYWIYLLIFLPYIGAIAYIVVVILPGFLASHKTQKAVSAIGKSIAPGRRAKELEQQLAHSPTIANQIALADEYYDSGHYQKASQTFRESLTGIYKDDKNLRLKLSRSLVQEGDFAQAWEVLQKLEAEQAVETTVDKLNMIRCRENLGIGEGVLESYRSLFNTTQNFEAGYYYVASLVRAGRKADAKKVIEDMNFQYRQHKSLRSSMGKEWMNRAEAAVFKE